jgi:hypothetical protein
MIASVRTVTVKWSVALLSGLTVIARSLRRASFERNQLVNAQPGLADRQSTSAPSLLSARRIGWLFGSGLYR